MKNYFVIQVEDNLTSIYWNGKLISLGFGIEKAIENIDSKRVKNLITKSLSSINQETSTKCTTAPSNRKSL